MPGKYFDNGDQFNFSFPGDVFACQAECEATEQCTCWIWDQPLLRCVLKSGCTGSTGDQAKLAAGFKGCKFEAVGTCQEYDDDDACVCKDEAYFKDGDPVLKIESEFVTTL